MTTGGSPASTGVYYDVSWDNSLSPAGSDCSTRGALVPFNQTINFNANTGDSVADINPAKLPRDPDNGCSVVYPHQFLKVNTIYEVAHAAGLRTAVADKHPSYEILSGPSGTGIDDFYGPEFNAAKADITKIMANDELKVAAVLNQIDGLNHQGTATVGVPAIFGMNFQAPNIGQKFSGYVDGAGSDTAEHHHPGPADRTPPGLAQALDYVDGAIGRMLSRIEANGLTDDTMIILTAKHANSPVDRSTLRWVDPSVFAPLINSVQPGLTAQVTADTMALIWLKDRSRAADVGGGARRRTRRRSEPARSPAVPRWRHCSPGSSPGTRAVSPTSSCNQRRGRLRGAEREAGRPRKQQQRRHPCPTGHRRTRPQGRPDAQLPRLGAADRANHPARPRPQGELPGCRSPRGHRAPDQRR